MKRKSRRKPPVQNPMEKTNAIASTAARAFADSRPHHRGAGALADFARGSDVGRPSLGPPLIGSSARLASALLDLRKASKDEGTEGERCAAQRKRDPQFPTYLDAALQRAHERVMAARARVNAIKEEIRQTRIARGKQFADLERLARELFGPDDADADAPLLPGYRPKPGERKRPVAEKVTPTPSYADQVFAAFEKHLNRSTQ